MVMIWPYSFGRLARKNLVQYYENPDQSDKNYYDQYLFFIQWGKDMRTGTAGP